METYYIGICGVAGSGKDTFFSYLKDELEKKNISVKRYSFGDCLKEEVNEWTTKHYEIDSINCTREEKNSIRSMLIAHGTILRKKTKGQYWINKLQEKIDNDKNKPEVACITDVRYNHYDNDETSWIKKKNGVLLYISRIINSGEEKELKAEIPEEKIHDPKVKAVADYIARITDVEEDMIPKVLKKEVHNFLNWLKEAKEDK